MGTFDGPILTVPCTNSTLDRWLNIRGCCEAHARFERELVAAMKVMKYAMQPPHFAQTRGEFESDFGFASEVLKYSLMDLEESCEALELDKKVCDYFGFF